VSLENAPLDLKPYKVFEPQEMVELMENVVHSLVLEDKIK